jgi:hypothetical protein
MPARLLRDPSSGPAPRRLLAALGALGTILLLAPGLAPAAPLRLSVLQAPHAPARVDVRVHGARNARSVALDVDGRLRQRDLARPWEFRHHGWLRLSAGRHRIVVVARFRRGRQVRRRVVFVPSGKHGGSRPRHRRGSILWRGDFETGDLSQWEVIQRVAADRIAVTRDPRAQGSYAARFEVRPGDNIGDTSPRAELAANLGEREGEERYYRWYTYFPPSFPTGYPNSFITFTQWRADDESDAYSSFMVWGHRVELRRGGTRWSTRLTKGVWHKFVYRVRWSPAPRVGLIELWYDNKLVLPKTHTRTMAGSPGAAVGNYVKEGLYKSEEIPTGVLYQDGFVAGTSFEAVNDAP